MKLLTTNIDYIETNNIATNLYGDYDKSVIFHCYWNGTLNEKHYYSILSCYYFNIYKHIGKSTENKIILWLEYNTPNKYNTEIEKYAEIRYFSLKEEIDNTLFMNNNIYYNKDLIFYSDLIRYLLLYNYSGMWFDLDCFFLRSFDPIFYNFKNDICVYQWEKMNYPNNAIYISLEPRSEKLKYIMEFIITRNMGWGFQEAQLTFDLPLDLLILPCSWFDAGWLPNPYNIDFHSIFKSNDLDYDFDNFFKGCFCFHWHNKWNDLLDDRCIIMQLVKIIQNNLCK